MIIKQHEDKLDLQIIKKAFMDDLVNNLDLDDAIKKQLNQVKKE